MTPSVELRNNSKEDFDSHGFGKIKRTNGKEAEDRIRKGEGVVREGRHIAEDGTSALPRNYETSNAN